MARPLQPPPCARHSSDESTPRRACRCATDSHRPLPVLPHELLAWCANAPTGNVSSRRHRTPRARELERAQSRVPQQPALCAIPANRQRRSRQPPQAPHIAPRAASLPEPARPIAPRLSADKKSSALHREQRSCNYPSSATLPTSACDRLDQSTTIPRSSLGRSSPRMIAHRSSCTIEAMRRRLA